MSCCGENNTNNCGVDYASLPLLAGCPANDETILVGNAENGKGTGKYARRTYGDVKDCISSGITISFDKLNFTVGDTGAPIEEGDTDLIITVTNPIEDSEIVVLDNNFIVPDMTNQISYSISYSSTEIIITFNQAVINGQKYYIKYAKK